jgi:hypothetical protein
VPRATALTRAHRLLPFFWLALCLKIHNARKRLAAALRDETGSVKGSTAPLLYATLADSSENIKK